MNDPDLRRWLQDLSAGRATIPETRGAAPGGFGTATNSTPFDLDSRLNYSHVNGVPSPKTHRDYEAAARERLGEVWENSILWLCLTWLGDNFLTARPYVRQRMRDGTYVEEKGHPVERLLRRPNDFTTQRTFWKSILLNSTANGNGYARLDTNDAGEPTAMWATPYWEMKPRRDNPNEFISGWTRRVNSTDHKVRNRDLIHFKDGEDPANPMLGMSRARRVLRSIMTDVVADDHIYNILQNGGVANTLITPRFQEETRFRPRQQEDFEDTWQAKLGSGAPVLFDTSLIAQPLASDPGAMRLSDLRRSPEYRIIAAMGLNPMVLGLSGGTGQDPTFANMRQAELQAWQNGLIPRLDEFAEAVTWALIPLFRQDPLDFEVKWDYREVKALQENAETKARTAVAKWKANLITLDEARKECGDAPLPKGEGKVYFLQLIRAQKEAAAEAAAKEIGAAAIAA